MHDKHGGRDDDVDAHKEDFWSIEAGAAGETRRLSGPAINGRETEA